jgi:hypothetical protein
MQNFPEADFGATSLGGFHNPCPTTAPPTLCGSSAEGYALRSAREFPAKALRMLPGVVP